MLGGYLQTPKGGFLANLLQPHSWVAWGRVITVESCGLPAIVTCHRSIGETTASVRLLWLAKPKANLETIVLVGASLYILFRNDKSLALPLSTGTPSRKPVNAFIARYCLSIKPTNCVDGVVESVV